MLSTEPPPDCQTLETRFKPYPPSKPILSPSLTLRSKFQFQGGIGDASKGLMNIMSGVNIDARMHESAGN